MVHLVGHHADVEAVLLLRGEVAHLEEREELSNISNIVVTIAMSVSLKHTLFLKIFFLSACFQC